MATDAPLVEEIETYAQDIVDTVREPLLMLDTTLRVRSAKSRVLSNLPGLAR
jgi:hypothetical protein